jgi:hypothetical protein
MMNQVLTLNYINGHLNKPNASIFNILMAKSLHFKFQYIIKIIPEG